MVKFLILDEAEKWLEPDFYEQLKYIFDKLPKRKFRQNLLFSATFNDDVKGIAKYCLNNYYYFCPIIESPKQIKHEFYRLTSGEEKIENLFNFLKKDEIKDKSILIFLNSKKDVESLNKILQNENIKSCTIHGDKMQNDRNKSLREFSLGYKNVLISTDIISRGIDFPNVYCVINFDMPNNIDDYIHRVGRTGRLGQKGLAITYVDNIDETCKEKLIQLLNNLGQEVPSWFNDVQSNRKFRNFLDKMENRDNNKNYNNNNILDKNKSRNGNNLNNNNYKFKMNKDNNYNRKNNWKKNDDNDSWGSNNNSNNNNDRRSNKNNNNNDGWGNNNNNDEWGSDNNKNENDNNDEWGSNNNKNDNWGNNNTNKKDNWKSKSNDNDGWGSSTENNNNDGWGNNYNNNDRFKNNNNFANKRKNRNDTFRNNDNKNDNNDWGSNDNSGGINKKNNNFKKIGYSRENNNNNKEYLKKKR